MMMRSYHVTGRMIVASIRKIMMIMIMVDVARIIVPCIRIMM